MPYYNATKVPPCPGKLYISVDYFVWNSCLPFQKARLHLSHCLRFLDRVCNDFATLSHLRLHLLPEVMTPSAGRTDTLDQGLSDDSTMPIAFNISAQAHQQANRTAADLEMLRYYRKIGCPSCLQGCRPTLPGVVGARETNHSCMMCCQTDPTRPSYSLIPAVFLAIRKHDGSRLPERPCFDPSSTSSYPDLSRSFLT